MPEPQRQWRVASANIQAGICTHRYADFVTSSWRHVCHSPRHKQDHLRHIASRLDGLDVLGIQEADSGSRRSGHIDQAGHLARQAGFNQCSVQTNRITPWSRTANALLSRDEPLSVVHHNLPSAGKRPSPRGVMVMTLADTSGIWHAVNAHFSLVAADRKMQSAFLAELIQDLPHVLVMGDFNAPPQAPCMAPMRAAMPDHSQLPTWPRWSPRLALDGFWWKGLEVHALDRSPISFSDHAALEIRFSLPRA